MMKASYEVVYENNNDVLEEVNDYETAKEMCERFAQQDLRHNDFCGNYIVRIKYINA